MTDIQVRLATQDDIEFIVASNAAMAQETEDKGLDLALLEQGIRYLLTHPDEGFYLIAHTAGLAVGTLMVTFEWSDWRNGRFWWIQSVYVTAHARRTGVYKAMHQEVIERARRDPQSCGIRLYVEQDNTIAQQTYRSLQMYQTHYQLFEMLFTQPR